MRNLTHFTLRGHELSPVKHLYLKATALERPQKVELLEKFVDKVSETRIFDSFMSHQDYLLFFYLSNNRQPIDMDWY